MHEILHKCFDIQSDNMLTRNRDIRVHIWVVIPLFIPHVIIHLQLMFNDTQVRSGILFRKDAIYQIWLLARVHMSNKCI